MLLLSEFFYSLYLTIGFWLSEDSGGRWPRSYRGKTRRTFNVRKGHAEAGVSNMLKYSPLISYLIKKKKDFAVVAYTDQHWLWVNVYQLDKTPTGECHISTYNEMRGQDGTFTFHVEEGRLGTTNPSKKRWYIPEATLMTYCRRLTNKEMAYLEDLQDADTPQHEILEITS